MKSNESSKVLLTVESPKKPVSLEKLSEIVKLKTQIKSLEHLLESQKTLLRKKVEKLKAEGEYLTPIWYDEFGIERRKPMASDLGLSEIECPTCNIKLAHNSRH